MVVPQHRRGPSDRREVGRDHVALYL